MHSLPFDSKVPKEKEREPAELCCEARKGSWMSRAVRMPLEDKRQRWGELPQFLPVSSRHPGLYVLLPEVGINWAGPCWSVLGPFEPVADIGRARYVITNPLDLGSEAHFLKFHFISGITSGYLLRT